MLTSRWSGRFRATRFSAAHRRVICRFPMILHKYLPPSRVDVLERCAIRYTQPAAFNDPFDAKPYLGDIDPRDERFEREIDLMLKDEIVKLYSSLSEEIRAQMTFETALSLATSLREQQRGKFASYANAFIPEIRRTMQSVFDEQIGILSLSADPFSILMWSHYTDCHTGFVIGFDSGHSHFNQKRNPDDEFNHLRKVEYRERRPNAPFPNLDGADVFLAKALDWGYEREWRILRPIADAPIKLPSTDPPICLFPFPPDCIVEVILGARLARETKEQLIAATRSSPALSRAEWRQAVLSETEFKISANTIDI